MAPSKIIAVVGATGNQGSSVAKVFLSLPGWNVRCVTRQPNSDKAKALGALGADLVQADLKDIESLSRAFQGVNAIFVNTTFLEITQTALEAGKDQITGSQIAHDEELQYAKNAAIAASKIPGLEIYIYSAFASINAASGGKYTRALHWESKAAAVAFIEKELPELSKKASFIYVGGYYDNLFLHPQLNPENGKYSLVLPTPAELRFGIINAAESTGYYVRALVEEEEPGTKLLAYDDDISIDQALEIWTKVSGTEADFAQMDMQTMHELFGVPLGYLEAAAFVADYGYTAGIEGVITPDQLRTKVKRPSYEEYLLSLGAEHLLGPTK
ncbi:hypothetical protein BGZ61DRAFT_355634 [Ilyonectria robusta]|uniref:uncharacterized protein n=1 Tax=Ilyonectria robusta TaxID=1079257 RepID=UPI001E8CF11F|nr:uncharacterized protein BGZ61DRAFT_355634 [Ilyonectria robusta]KAH8686518.1 hypothetical protein BGZ61DRAFT_355634 [Ilyonectria robusta]